MKLFLKTIFHLFLIVFLTALTQIGGVIHLLSISVISNKSRGYKLKRKVLFIGLYLVATFLLIPNIAPKFGREKIKDSNLVEAHTFFTKLTNRNYVKPEMNSVLADIGKAIQKKHKGIKLVYLDANFPFIDGFPLPPHLSHSDGKKIDISLIYQTPSKILVNDKPSVSGYGVYEDPKKKDINYVEACKEKGNWQYDFPKYLTFGTINKGLVFSDTATKNLILEIIKQSQVGKIFIEPHLKNRLHLKSKKIRFHGCQAVRHDDHIHFQLR